MISAAGVGIRFLFDRQRRVVTPAQSRLRRRGAEVWGLRDVSFTMPGGQGFALLGRSGSGKTTLLRLLAGIYHPDAGQLRVAGRVASLLSVEAGLLGLLTGRENSLHLAVLAGLTRAESRAAIEEVKEASGLGDYFERPVSSYSQGMRARLGLAVAEQTRPTILLLDEVHEALDHEFRGVLENHAHAIIARGGVVVAAGHDHPMLERLCEHGLWLDEGRIRAHGNFREVQSAYFAEA